jgi:osmotically-inducible protein OsmY
LPRSYALESGSVRHITETAAALRHSKYISSSGIPLRTHSEDGFDALTQQTDDAIAVEVDAALQQAGYWQNDEISVSVTRRWVTLSGQIEWDYQKRTAIYAVRALPGVLGVTDKIVLRFVPVSLTSPDVRLAQHGQINKTTYGVSALKTSFA